MNTNGKYTQTIRYAFNYGITLDMFIKRHPKLPLRRIKVLYKYNLSNWEAVSL